MTITNSPDITLLQVRVVFDLSLPVPVIRFINQSQGANLAGVSYFFDVISPGSLPVHTSKLTLADVSGVWTTYDLPDKIPTFRSSIEWSGSPYKVQIKARDSAGTIYSSPVQHVPVCAPAGNAKAGGNYGEAKVEISVDCQIREALIKDRTQYSYQGVAGVIQGSSTLTVLQPPDQGGVVPPAQSYQGYSQVAFPLTSTGDGFRVVVQTICDFDFPQTLVDNTIRATVRLKYVRTQSFDVNCNYDLCPILYEHARLLEQAEKSCDPHMDRKIGRINSLIVEALIVKMQPACGISLGKLIDEIKALAGWTCDCNCSETMGLNGSEIVTAGGGSGGGSGDGTGVNIQFLTEGDITGVAKKTGKNILITLKDYKYLITVGDTGARAFSFVPSTDQRVKTWALNVDLEDLSEDLLQKIGSVPALLDAFNALVKSRFNFTVDGKCIINSSPACDYDLSIPGIPLAPLSALFVSITIGGVVYPVNISFSTTTRLTELKTALDALGKGAFTVTVSGNTLVVHTTANQNAITEAIIFGAGSASNQITNISKSNCTGTVTYTPSQIVQAIIDYLCVINATQVRLGYDFVFAKMKPDGTLQEVSFKSTDSLKMFIDAVSSNAAIAISLGQNAQNVSYTTIQQLFDDQTTPISATDVLYGTRDGGGGQWTQTDVVKRLIATVMGSNDSTFLADWCQAVNRCQVTLCNPVVFGLVEMRTITKEDFILDGSQLTFSGFYNTHVLTAPVTINFQQVSQTGQIGTTAQTVMLQGENRINNVVSLLPILSPGYSWKVSSISTTGTKVYMTLAILNNGSASYRAAVRTVGSSLPFNYTTYPAQPGQYTRLIFDIPANNYEASVIAVCGVNSQSQPLVVSNQACPAARTFNVRRVGANFSVSMAYPASVTRANITIQMPSGGIFSQNYDTNLLLTVIDIPIPEGVFGDFSFRTRAVCNDDQENGWYGPFTSPVVLRVEQADTVQATLVGLQVSNIDATTATVTAIAPATVPPSVTTITLVVTPVAGGLSQYLTQVYTDLDWSLTGLTASTGYNVKVRYDFANGTSTALFDGGNFVTLSGTVVVTTHAVGSGFTTSNVNESNVAALLLQNTQTVNNGATSISIDFSGSPQYQTFIISEPVSEPLKTHYSNALNSEPVPDYTFINVWIVGPKRYYVTRLSSFDPAGPVILST